MHVRHISERLTALQTLWQLLNIQDRNLDTFPNQSFYNQLANPTASTCDNRYFSLAPKIPALLLTSPSSGIQGNMIQLLVDHPTYPKRKANLQCLDNLNEFLRISKRSDAAA
jgi:hypothetical protein